MRRVADFLIRNWPLKLGAILLAVILYSGLVLGQSVRTWTGNVPVDAIRLPAGAALLNSFEPVTLIRYRAPLDVGVLSPDSFRATVDLSRVQPETGGPPDSVPVTVIALDQRVQIVDYQPQSIDVRLDPVQERDLPVTVSLGTVPDGLNLGPPQIDPSSVTIRGASSRVQAVSQVVARVAMDASALNIDREIDLVPVDANGNQVPNVTLVPERARVRMAVARVLANGTLPIVPQLTGAPAAGYRITSVTVDPLIVSVSGEEAVVSRLENLTTEPIDVTGRTTDLEATVPFAVPEGVSVTGSDSVRVMIRIAPDTGTRTFQVAVTLSGQRTEQLYTPSVGQVQVTLAGAVSALNDVDTAGLIVTADVSALASGTQDVTLTLIPPPGAELVSITPDRITVVVADASSIPTAIPTQAIQ